MTKYSIFQKDNTGDKKELDTIYVTEDTNMVAALLNWLEDNGYEGKFEMVETESEDLHYADIEDVRIYVSL